MKLGTQNQSFFPDDFEEKFHYLKELGLDRFEIDGSVLVNHFSEVEKASHNTGLEVKTACGGYNGWIGDFIEERRKNGLKEIAQILEKLGQLNGTGIIVPAAWGMFTYRLPPMDSPRSQEGDFGAVSDSLTYLDEVARRTGTKVFLEPLNRYQDHMINTVADARHYIKTNQLRRVKVIGDFYHMNIEEDELTRSLHENKDIIEHIHLADNHRFQPGSGSINFKANFEQLRQDGYEGDLILECRIRANDPKQAFEESIDFLQGSLR
ncbi:sugar phosphate isomerase/epimerase family protein [Shouchella shacheensis]|uniref:sugar phosphate isomerase/epimerase family protein n=1 Tax=Shouchella shacheensis TaxID=1649580 RepID=UPI000740424E|nr:sugar phosphate isomerase/epimerase [Shouchella shacheensis]